MIHHFVVSAGTNQINIEELEPRPIINKVTIHINKLHKHQKDIRHENKLVSLILHGIDNSEFQEHFNVLLTRVNTFLLIEVKRNPS